MEANNTLKVPSGKLIKVELDFDPNNKIINNIKITGDFFLHPEETLEQLEKMLCTRKLIRPTLYKMIGNFLRDNKVELYGITPDFLVDAILGCVGRR